MTMPGTRTSLLITSAVSSRNCSMFSPERMVIWTRGIASSMISFCCWSDCFMRGNSIDRAARVAAFSNYAALSDLILQYNETITHQWQDI